MPPSAPVVDDHLGLGAAARTGLQVMDSDGTGQHWVDGRCGVEHQVDWGTAPLE